MESKVIFITGMSGYIGTCLCRELDRLDWCKRFYGMDIRKPLYKFDNGEFRKMDINDPGLADWVREIKPDIMLHLAYILEQSHDLKLMHRVNYDGSINALKAAAEAGVPQVLAMSSGTAYGAWPDNPVPLKEENEARPNPGFYYAVDKGRMEVVCRKFMNDHPDVILAVMRPCVVYGPNVNNYLSRLLENPIVPSIYGHNPPLQFVHEDDVVRGLIHVLVKKAKGFINLAPPDTVTLLEVIGLSKKIRIPFPYWFAEPMVDIFWKLRLPRVDFSSGFIDYIRYPWVLDAGRLCDELGFKYRYSTRETVEIMLRAKQILP